MLIGGGWTYNSIIETKPELKGKIGTALEPAGPSGKDTAFAGGSHLVVFEDSENKDTGQRVRRLHARSPANLTKFTERDRLPARHRRPASRRRGYLDDPLEKPFAEQLLDHSAVYPPSPRWGALEGANIFDGEIQKVMKGEETPQDGGQDLAEKMDEEFAG